MLDIRDLQFLNALALHRHFAKAAAACGVSQPAFSMRIRNLEDRLDTTIVKRGNRFQGLTAEGEEILRHARTILDDVRKLEQALSSAKGAIAGLLTLAVVPTAAAYAADLAIRLYAVHPGIRMRIETASSLAIQQRIDEGSIDAGITYADSVSADVLTVDPLYEERYVVLAPTRLAPRTSGTITWAEAADLPLSLLEPAMQNRRILDRMFAEQGLRPHILSETNALTTAMVMACAGLCATVVPDVLVRALGPLTGTVVLPLTDPVLTKSISLVAAPRRPGLPVVEALQRVVRSQP